MLTIFQEFYNNKNIPDLLDDDTILINKENNNELKEFLINNHQIVEQMLNYFQYDEYETDHKILIKYPFIISELLSSINVINKNHLTLLFEILQNQNIQQITIGYIAKIFMNLLKNDPILFWSNIQLNNLDIFINEINNYQISELIYSMIIFQIQDNQLEFIIERKLLVDKLLLQINTNLIEGISQVLCMILQQITQTLQEQKSIIIQHIFSQIDIFISNYNQQPQFISNILINLIQHQQYYENEINQIYNSFLIITEETKQKFLQNEQIFGIQNLSQIQFYDILTDQQYFIQNIQIKEYIDLLFLLIQKYQYNNQLHKKATNIILKLLPYLDCKQFFESALIELKQKPIKGNRGYILQIINKIIELNKDYQIDEIYEEINKNQNNYLLDVIPDQKPQFNLQEEFEAAMNKLQI